VDWWLQCRIPVVPNLATLGDTAAFMGGIAGRPMWRQVIKDLKTGAVGFWQSEPNVIWPGYRFEQTQSLHIPIQRGTRQPGRLTLRGDEVSRFPNAPSLPTLPTTPPTHNLFAHLIFGETVIPSFSVQDTKTTADG